MKIYAKTVMFWLKLILGK